jgi:hypothetical protein
MRQPSHDAHQDLVVVASISPALHGAHDNLGALVGAAQHGQTRGLMTGDRLPAHDLVGKSSTRKSMLYRLLPTIASTRTRSGSTLGAKNSFISVPHPMLMSDYTSVKLQGYTLPHSRQSTPKLYHIGAILISSRCIAGISDTVACQLLGNGQPDP